MFFFVLCIVTFLCISIIFLRSKRRGKNSTFLPEELDILTVDINQIDKMTDGSEFELYLYCLFNELGYTGVYKTVNSGDFGADLVFVDRSGTRTVIQAKRYSIDNPVGLSAVQEIYTSMRYYKAKKSIVIATASFTASCETLAGINHVKLLDRKDLIEIINAFKQGKIDIAKDIIEAEPRVILDSWNDYQNENLEIKKDKKAAVLIRKT